MRQHGNVRQREFCAFARESVANLKARRQKDQLPFAGWSADDGQRYYGPPDFLAWVLWEALRAHGVSVTAAAVAVRATDAAEEFLAALTECRGAHDRFLVVWREVSNDADGRREKLDQAVMREAEIDLLRARYHGPRTLHDPVLVSMVIVHVEPAWREAIARARAAGLDLTPGSVAQIEKQDAA